MWAHFLQILKADVAEWGREEERKAEWENGDRQEDFQRPSNSEHL